MLTYVRYLCWPGMHGLDDGFGSIVHFEADESVADCFMRLGDPGFNASTWIVGLTYDYFAPQ